MPFRKKTNAHQVVPVGGYAILWLSRSAHRKALTLPDGYLLSIRDLRAPSVATLWGFFLCCSKYMDELENGQICVAGLSRCGSSEQVLKIMQRAENSRYSEVTCLTQRKKRVANALTSVCEATQAIQACSQVSSASPSTTLSMVSL